ncbi:hypothetical protein GQ53DRAFT_140189 [Thozetella sp. PMI_491]|nr:hypothetical protein GQ53DRAFT_140189 [Thozetella sp. PMI_491]
MSAEDVRYFKSIPWCAELLEQPGVRICATISRLDLNPNKGGPSNNTLFVRTLNTEDAIPHCIGFYRDPLSPETPGLASDPNVQGPASSADDGTSRVLVRSSSIMFDLRPGVNGSNGTAHGGLITSLIDEAMGNMFLANAEARERATASGRALPPDLLDFRVERVITAGMDVRLKKPLITPGIAVLTAHFVQIKDRKMVMTVEVTGEQGVTFATGGGTWLLFPPKKNKL